MTEDLIKIKQILDCLAKISSELELSKESQDKIREILFTESKEFRRLMLNGLSEVNQNEHPKE